MKGYFAVLIIIMVGLVLAGCGGAAADDIQRSKVERVTEATIDQAAITAAADSNNAFGLDLYGSVRGTPGNLVFSPYSISSALAMTYAGARNATASQMAAALHFDLAPADLYPALNQLDAALTSKPPSQSVDQQPLQLRIANGVWTERTLILQEEYLDLIAATYGAGIHLADFITAYEPTRLAINAWVNAQTEGQIHDLLAQGTLDTTTRMVLVNAVYFRADWQDQFEADETQDASFHLMDGTEIQVPMMHGQLASASHAAMAGYQVVELPYVGGSAAMDILVPDSENFKSVENDLDSEMLKEAVAALQPASVQLGLPKFRFGTNLDLGDRLKALGMPDALDPEKADFSGMTGGRDLFISKVLHQAQVAVDEKGTEAAAATAVIMGPTSIQVSKVALTVDRPFVFFVRDTQTGQILFLGRVLNPGE